MNSITKSILLLVMAMGFVNVQAAESKSINLPRGLNRPARTVKNIKSMKAGDQYVKVCMECKSATVQTVENQAEVEKLCHDGGKVHCESCEKTYEIKRTGPPGKEHVHREVKYLNEKGEECMVVIPLKQ